MNWEGNGHVIICKCSAVFSRVTPSSQIEVRRRFEGMYCFLAVPCLAISSVSSMEAMRYSETSANLYPATWRHIAELTTPHAASENLKSSVDCESAVKGRIRVLTCRQRSDVGTCRPYCRLHVRCVISVPSVTLRSFYETTVFLIGLGNRALCCWQRSPTVNVSALSG
jgi:hypothetical protein